MHRALAATFLFLLFGASSAEAQCPSESPCTAETPEVMGIFIAGPALEHRAAGAGAGLGLAVGGGGVYFTLGGRISGGAAWNSNPSVQIDAEMGVRAVVPLASALAAHVLVTLDYGHAWVWGQHEYRYHIYQARLGGGLLFGTGRVRPGFEVAVHAGYRDHANKLEENPWGSDYSSGADGGFPLAMSGSLRFMLAF